MPPTARGILMLLSHYFHDATPDLFRGFFYYIRARGAKNCDLDASMSSCGSPSCFSRGRIIDWWTNPSLIQHAMVTHSLSPQRLSKTDAMTRLYCKRQATAVYSSLEEELRLHLRVCSMSTTCMNGNTDPGEDGLTVRCALSTNYPSHLTNAVVTL